MLLLSADQQVLDSGRLKEYDEPYILLQNEESQFYKMVQQLGKAEAAALLETAKQVSAPQGGMIKVGLNGSLAAVLCGVGSTVTNVLCSFQL